MAKCSGANDISEESPFGGWLSFQRSGTVMVMVMVVMVVMVIDVVVVVMTMMMV